MPTRILSLDTSTEACSAALWVDGQVFEQFELVQQQHSQRILPMVDAVLAEGQCSLKQCDALAFGRGPGSFTGVRIGTGVAQGLAFGADLPVVPVSSLAAVAQAQRAAHVLVAFDARMDQVYWGCFARNAQGGMLAVGEEAVSHPPEIRLPDPDTVWVGAGSGWDRYADHLLVTLDGAIESWQAEQYPHAAQVAMLAADAVRRGEQQLAQAAIPVYLRDNVAAKPRAR
jgi:tRNA threonylcarbamoyladenosine biosynthesis protein TsaB